MQTENVLTVTQLNSLVRDLIDGSFASVTLEGEVSNWRPAASGHVYFTLKDETSQISAVMWRSTASALKFLPKDGMLVRCRGKLSVYIQRGSYQIVVSRMDLAGSGNILQMLEERKQKFLAEGLFDESRKKDLPPFPGTLGVITSPSGAALRDILQITKRRNDCISVTVLPALVQGEGAAETIARQIKIANDHKLCDVLIVGRGGGSLEDLLPFSEEVVVRAVAESDIPIVSAVGHEIDWALCDYAADVRAPTPSAAAELIVPQKIDIQETLRYYQEELHRLVSQKTERSRLTIRTFNTGNLELMFRRIEEPLANRFDNARQALERNLELKIKATREKVARCAEILESSSPKAIFARGYAMVTDSATGQIVRDASAVRAGSKIEIVPAVGKIRATVDAASAL